MAGEGDHGWLLDLVTLPADGTYTLRIEPAGGSISMLLDDTGDYSFAVWTARIEHQGAGADRVWSGVRSTDRYSR